MAGIEFDGALVVPDGRTPLALGQKAAGELEVVLGVVAGLVLQLGEHSASFRQVALLALDAGPLKVHLAGGVSRFLGLFEGLERLVVFVAIRERASQVEGGQRPFGLFEVLDRFPEVTQEE